MNKPSLWSDYFKEDIHCAGTFKHWGLNNSNLTDRHLVTMNQTHSNDIQFIDCLNNQINSSLIQVNGTPPPNKTCLEMTNKKQPSHVDIGNNINALDNVSPLSITSVDADATITRSSNVILSVRTADCLPVVVNGGNYIAVIHAGRAGTLLNITKRVCLTLKSFNVKKISVWFGPACCVSCYEIDKETRSHFDLIEENKQQINDIYSSSNVIFDKLTPSCTLCRNDLFYSYRAGDTVKRNSFFFSFK